MKCSFGRAVRGWRGAQPLLEAGLRIGRRQMNEQRARLDELHAEFKEEHGPGAGGHHCPSHGDRSDNA